jgi:hypothetical protein
MFPVALFVKLLLALFKLMTCEAVMVPLLVTVVAVPLFEEVLIPLLEAPLVMEMVPLLFILIDGAVPVDVIPVVAADDDIVPLLLMDESAVVTGPTVLPAGLSYAKVEFTETPKQISKAIPILAKGERSLDCLEEMICKDLRRTKKRV